MMGQSVVEISEVLIRSGAEVLLVRQQKAADPEPYWTLPGGLLEPGELPTGAAFRETLEEMGLSIRDPGRLAYLSAHDSPRRGGQLRVFCFETSEWNGDVTCDDPDGVVSEAGFFPVPRPSASWRTQTYPRCAVGGCAPARRPPSRRDDDRRCVALPRAARRDRRARGPRAA